MMNFENARGVLENEAKALGLEEYEIYFTESQGVSTETLKSEIASFSCGRSAGINFRCVVDGHIGSAATELLEETELRSLVSRARANASVIENNDIAVIFGGSEKYADAPAVSGEIPSAADIKTLAMDIQGRTYAQSELITDGTQSGVVADVSKYELANSKGLRLSNTVSLRLAYVQAVINKDGDAQDAFDFALGFDNTEALSEKAVSDAISKLGAAGVESGKYDVIIDGSQMRALLSTFSSVFSGKNALLGLSLLSGKKGEKIASECVTVVDDPLGERNPARTHFDGEGVATYTKNVIENGVLKTLLYDIATAHKAGEETTGNGLRGSFASQVHIAPFCFYVKEGCLTDEELMARMGDGLYVTELKGLHAGANAVTGDFSIESAGYLVKDGRIAGAVKGFTIAGNFFELLKSISDVSSNVKFGMPSGFTTYGAPNVLVSQMSVAGK